MNSTFTKKKNDREEILYEIILTYQDEKTKKNYMIYTDGLENENGSLNLFGSLYQIEQENILPIEISSLEDQKIIDEILSQLVVEEIE